MNLHHSPFVFIPNTVSPEGSVNVSLLSNVSSQGSNITFMCNALGGPNNTFQWEMNGNIIGNSSILEVMDIDTSSGGIYTCTVSNAAGNDSVSTFPYNVTLLEPTTTEPSTIPGEATTTEAIISKFESWISDST